MTVSLRIDFVSDVVCPWCVIGLRSLTRALDALEGEVVADIRFQPFELNPGMPAEGQDLNEHVAQKYGSSPERSRQVREVIRETGASLGFEFVNRPGGRIWNTFDAHRLIHWASLSGRGRAVKEALFEAYFREGGNPSEPEVLQQAAAAAGLDGADAERVIRSGEFADEVRREEAFWRDRGVSAVPSVVFAERWMIQGGQAPEVFERAIRHVCSQLRAEPAV